MGHAGGAAAAAGLLPRRGCRLLGPRAPRHGVWARRRRQAAAGRPPQAPRGEAPGPEGAALQGDAAPHAGRDGGELPVAARGGARGGGPRAQHDPVADGVPRGRDPALPLPLRLDRPRQRARQRREAQARPPLADALRVLDGVPDARAAVPGAREGPLPPARLDAARVLREPAADGEAGGGCGGRRGAFPQACGHGRRGGDGLTHPAGAHVPAGGLHPRLARSERKGPDDGRRLGRGEADMGDVPGAELGAALLARG
uniref:Uncharacterized protein n=2 Tax=Tetraselmis sp. GSL018 TaxID=582737 RepID=A0A061SJW7_9CHLO